MSINWPMLKRGGYRLMAGRPLSIRTVARREWELCGQEVTPTSPAIYSEETLENISGLSPFRDWKTEWPLIRGDLANHAPTIAYIIENAELSGAFLYRKAVKSRHGFGDQKLLISDGEKPIYIEEACLVSDRSGSRFFGNFLMDSFPLEILPDTNQPVIAMVRKEYDHEAGYRRLLSLPRPPLVSRAKIGRLTVYSDFAQNSLKKQRYRILRDRMRSSLSDTGSKRPQGVFLKRGSTGEHRILSNESDVEELLSKRGFDIIEPAVLGAEEIARRSLNAPIVVSVEGSHLSHAIYTIADEGAFLVLQPPDRFAMAYKEFSDRLDLRFSFIVGTPSRGGFAIDLDKLSAMVDRLA